MGCYRKGIALSTHKTEKVDLGNDTYVIVRELTSGDFLDLEAKYPSGSTSTVFEVVTDLLSRCLVDDEGKNLFTDAKDLQTSFPVGLSTIWALRDTVDRLSAPKGKDGPNV